MLFTLQGKRHKPINVDEADKVLYLDFRVEENRSEQSQEKRVAELIAAICQQSPYA